MRQKSSGIKTKGNHGYALTQKKAFDNIMGLIRITGNDRFIDIGCGKGGCLLYASEYPFKRVAGVEIEDGLYKIAVNNFKRLKMPQIEIYHGNAVTFKKYSDFNVFFLFNPFDVDIYQTVINRIIDTFDENREDNRGYIICYGASITDYIEAKGSFKLLDSYKDSIRNTDVNIWEWDRAQSAQKG